MRSLKILHVVPSYYPAVRYGGPIRSVHALCAGLVRRGHRVEVYTTNVDGPQNSAVPVGQPVDMDGVTVHYFGVPAFRRLYWSPSMAVRLERKIAEFDVVHLHSVFLWPTWMAARSARAAQVPYVLSPRGQLVRELIRRKSRWLKQAWIALIEKHNLTRAAAVHLTSELEARSLTELNLDLSKLVCIPNGVDWPALHKPFDAVEFPAIVSPYVLYLGRINWKKGIDRLIRAWEQIPGITLIIAGNDEEGHQKTLEALVGGLNLNARVRFIGPVSDERKWALYENAEAFVLPSYSENFGNVVAEAMAMGCPVVVTREVGLAKFVADTGAGIVADGDPENLGHAILELCADRDLRQKMGAAGRAAVKEYLSWDAAAAKMESAYEEICSLVGPSIVAGVRETESANDAGVAVAVHPRAGHL